MELKNHKNDLIAIGFLIIISSILTYILLNIDTKIGVYYIRDMYSYINNALSFAGYNVGGKNKGLSPFIPFLTSIAFRLGFISDSTIMIISSLFYILSGLGIYALLRYRFKELLSVTGAIILITLPINIVWATKGMLDIPGLAMSIWAIYFMVLGIYRNPKYYYIAFPILVIGFFTRYTVIFTLPIMLMMILFVKKPLNYIKDKIKYLIGGIFSGGICLTIFLIGYKLNNMPLFFLSQSETISSTTSSPITTATVTTTKIVTNNIFYYLNNIPLYLGTYKWVPYSFKPGCFNFSKMTWLGNTPSILSIIFSVIIIVGLIKYLCILFNKTNRKLIEDNKSLKFYIKLILIIGLSITFLITFSKISIYFSLILISILILALYKLIYKAPIKYIAFDFTFIYWGFINIVFYSYHIIKVDRYAITFTPMLVYMIILGMYIIYNLLENYNLKRKYLNKIKIGIPILIICSCLIFTGACCYTNQPHSYDNHMHPDLMTAAQDQKEITDWIKTNDKNYKNEKIWADNGGGVSFNLRMNIPSVEKISNQSNFTNSLNQNNVTYYICKGKNTIITTDYKEIKEKGNCTLYKRKS